MAYAANGNEGILQDIYSNTLILQCYRLHEIASRTLRPVTVSGAQIWHEGSLALGPSEQHYRDLRHADRLQQVNTRPPEEQQFNSSTPVATKE